MSLIERAANRLAQLKKAGAVLTEQGSAPADADSPSARVPVPEAAMAKYRARELLRPPDAGRIAAAAGPDAVPPAAAPDGFRPRRRLEIDFDRLESRGYLRPDKPQTALAQELRAIKRPVLRNVRQMSDVHVANGNLVMVTSALPSEGKTYVSANLAISIAMEVDHGVVLVDGDVAHPSLPGVFGGTSEPGMLDVLSRDNVGLDDVLVETNIPGLLLLPAGRRDERATELLASARMDGLLQELIRRDPSRIFIFDSPPLLATAEATVLAAKMGQVVVTIAAGATPERAVTEAIGLLEHCDVVMTLLNKASETHLGSYDGYYRNDAGA